MSNNHKGKYLSKLLIGFSAITVGVLGILYACFERTRIDDWYSWGIVASFMINLGLYFVLQAFVHKIKADLIRKQKHREQQKTFTAE